MHAVALPLPTAAQDVRQRRAPGLSNEKIRPLRIAAIGISLCGTMSKVSLARGVTHIVVMVVRSACAAIIAFTDSL